MLIVFFLFIESTQELENEKEKQELAMLDEILAKAQQARDVQTKVRLNW